MISVIELPTASSRSLALAAARVEAEGVTTKQTVCSLSVLEISSGST
jgi:hypothetical protein